MIWRAVYYIGYLQGLLQQRLDLWSLFPCMKTTPICYNSWQKYMNPKLLSWPHFNLVSYLCVPYGFFCLVFLQFFPRMPTESNYKSRYFHWRWPAGPYSSAEEDLQIEFYDFFFLSLLFSLLSDWGNNPFNWDLWFMKLPSVLWEKMITILTTFQFSHFIALFSGEVEKITKSNICEEEEGGYNPRVTRSFVSSAGLA